MKIGEDRAARRMITEEMVTFVKHVPITTRWHLSQDKKIKLNALPREDFHIVKMAAFHDIS